jgi:hypothetical protein
MGQRDTRTTHPAHAHVPPCGLVLKHGPKGKPTARTQRTSTAEKGPVNAELLLDLYPTGFPGIWVDLYPANNPPLREHARSAPGTRTRAALRFGPQTRAQGQAHGGKLPNNTRFSVDL